jgi:hypothetical protein
MNINIEGNATDAVVEYVSSFHWIHGSLLIRKMADRQGLEQVIAQNFSCQKVMSSFLA